ncbi:hypothetical protein [Desulforamulus ruminis]|uniref:Uncharacterized protein n=1 Tax=Desulforamulus ruminis (strain ATCC 23193 / DSM 2154 / NCIMB 8452 / DL) TaxID=696281 RepID=F6DQE3_DESRL|nr:hypothetical protein [Desulforamulus ruminis]AEG60837.1 hypothetical protein Desru_2610 [Desulforamulus ruminis DSM 2154]
MADQFCEKIQKNITIEPKMDYESGQTQVGWLFFTCYNFYRDCKGSCPRQEYMIKGKK